jgi:AcrR family transcriptional regulator
MAPGNAQRSDARENRQRLIRAAREAFASEEQVTLESIASRAGVGIGTLYRHFPQREALVEAVYYDQIAELSQGAEALLRAQPPLLALRMWMDLFASWATAKRGMVETLAAMRRSGTLDFDASRHEIERILATMLAAGSDAGEVRPGVDAADLRSLLTGALAVTDEHIQRQRLLDLILDAVRSRTSTAGPASH